MKQLYRLGQSLWQIRAHRWLLAAAVGAAIGVAAGHTVKGSMSGSISVVDGQSMAPSYQSGARVYTAPISTPLLRGDVVLVDDEQRQYALKRIVGLPGETLELWRGCIFINRHMLREPYLPRHTYTHPDEHVHRYIFPLQSGQYFVLGDNRSCSIDSRTYGAVGERQIKSRVPALENNLRPTFAPYTLPAPGSRTIQPMEASRTPAPSAAETLSRVEADVHQ